MMKKGLIAIMLLVMAGVAQAQELRCEVKVDARKINGVDPSVFTTMQTALNDFMNSKAWTTDVYSPEEKIDCSIFILITESPAQDVYNAKITVTSSRPVFNSTYSSPMFSFVDNDCVITYAQNQALEFGTNIYNANLTSILGFYAYTILGMDYESFGKNGGAKYFALAEQVMNNVPTNAPDAKGWRPFDGTRNRYWLINNLQSGKYNVFKEALYDYHYAGMDNFYDKPALARQNIMNALVKLEKISKDNPNAVVLNVFFQAKSDELIGVFSGADAGEKIKALNYLRSMDPSHAGSYDKLTKN